MKTTLKMKVVSTWDWYGIPQTELEDDGGLCISISTSKLNEKVELGEIFLVDKWDDE